MRGLPPPPPDFVDLTATWEVNTSALCSTSWFIFAPGAGSADPSALETLAGEWFTTCLPDLLGIVGSDVTLSALRLTSYGTLPNRISYAPAPNAGALASTAPINACLCLTWLTSDAGRGRRGHTFLPLSSDLVDVNRSSLTSIGWSQAQAAARSYVVHVNELASPDGGNCVAAVLHRQHQGVPFDVSQWSGVVLGDASSRVATLRRRVRANDPFSSPF